METKETTHLENFAFSVDRILSYAPWMHSPCNRFHQRHMTSRSHIELHPGWAGSILRVIYTRPLDRIRTSSTGDLSHSGLLQNKIWNMQAEVKRDIFMHPLCFYNLMIEWRFGSITNHSEIISLISVTYPHDSTHSCEYWHLKFMWYMYYLPWLQKI